MIKQNSGITIITLVITVIIILLLCGITIGMGMNILPRSEDAKLISELNMVQHAILEQYTKFKTVKDTTLLLGNKVESTEVEKIATELGITLVTIPANYSNQDYYQLDKATLLELGIKNTNDEYIVNYISGEVINITVKKTSKNEPLYVKADNFN